MSESSVWTRFALDPRAAAHAELRAAHADREIVLAVLGEAYAEGRLEADEFEERANATQAARTLADLLPLLADLVPDRTPVVAAGGSAPAATDAMHRRAVEKWEAQRREALWGFLGPTLICWAIWGVVMLGGFPWPIIVMAATGLNLVATQVRRQDIIAAEVRRLERKAEKERAKALKKEQSRGELDSGHADPAEPAD